MNNSGIYRILSLVDGKYYVGSSKKLGYRIQWHFNALNDNTHHNLYLQRAWNKYGKENFVFEIIKSGDFERDELYLMEQIYLDNDDVKYNIAKHAKGGDNVTNNPRYDEICKNIGLGVKKYASSLSKDERKEKFGKNGEQNGMFGRNHSDETKLIISIKNKQRAQETENYRKGKTFEEVHGEEKALELRENLSYHASQRTGEKNPFFGKKHSDETKEIIRVKNIGKKHSLKTKLFLSAKSEKINRY